MSGGLAIRGNLLCVSYSDARGKIILIDSNDRRPVSFFEWGGGDAGFADAGGVAIDESLTIWVADAHNHCVRRFTPFGKQLGQLGLASDAPAGSRKRDRPGVLDHPRAVAVGEDIVWVAGGEGELQCGVQRFRADGTVLAPLRAFGDPEKGFGAPRGIAAAAGEVVVADTLHGGVQRFRTNGAFVASFACAPHDRGASRPIAVGIAADRTICVLDEGDQGGLSRFSATGEPLASVRSDEGLLEHPLALAVAGGWIYVLDRHGERIQRWSHDLRTSEAFLDLAEFLYGQ